VRRRAEIPVLLVEGRWDSDADQLIATATDRKTLNALAHFIDERGPGRYR
jgi:hypothetical protein